MNAIVHVFIMLFAPPSDPDPGDSTTGEPTAAIDSVSPDSAPADGPVPAADAPTSYAELSLSRAEINRGARWPAERDTVDLYWGVGISHARPVGVPFAISAIFGTNYMPLSWIGFNLESAILTHPADRRVVAGLFSLGPTIRLPAAWSRNSKGLEQHYLARAREVKRYRNAAAVLSGALDGVVGVGTPGGIGMHLNLGAMFFLSRFISLTIGGRIGHIWDLPLTSKWHSGYLGASVTLGFVLGRAIPQFRPIVRLDSDGDGTMDEEDACMMIPGMDAGCPADADGDGVVDAIDVCIWDPEDECKYPNDRVSGTLVIDLPDCKLGSKSCSCRDSDVCDEGLVCSASRCVVEVAKICPVETEGCSCGKGAVCGVGLVCDGGTCKPGESGEVAEVDIKTSPKVQYPTIKTPDELRQKLTELPLKVVYFPNAVWDSYTEDSDPQFAGYDFAWNLFSVWKPNKDSCYILTGHADERQPTGGEKVTNCTYSIDRADYVFKRIMRGVERVKQYGYCENWSPSERATPKPKASTASKDLNKDKNWYKRRVEIREVDCDFFESIKVPEGPVAGPGGE
jgi:hypothetical protein